MPLLYAIKVRKDHAQVMAEWDITLDCPMTSVITTNKPDVRNGSDVLHGGKTFDDVEFSR